MYLKYHDYWLFKRGAFVGKDKTMFNSLSLLFPERIITVWPSDPHAPNLLEDEENPLGACGDTYVLIPRSHLRPSHLQTSINLDLNMQPVVFPLLPFFTFGTANDWSIAQVTHLAYALADLLSC